MSVWVFLPGVLLLVLLTTLSTVSGLQCLFCLDANEHLDHCRLITCSHGEECFFERTVDRHTYEILHNAGCRAKEFCRFLESIPARERRVDIMTSAPVEYLSCSDCCDIHLTQHGIPCNALLCNQTTIWTHEHHGTHHHDSW